MDVRESRIGQLFERTIPEPRWSYAVPIKKKRAWKPKPYHEYKPLKPQN